jgi:hypothetical protein
MRKKEQRSRDRTGTRARAPFYFRWDGMMSGGALVNYCFDVLGGWDLVVGA